MKNPCGTARANILEKSIVNDIPVFFGTGVNPANSPAQFFVAWGKGVLNGGLIPTYNSDSDKEGFLWFIDEEEAEDKYSYLQRIFSKEM